MKNTYQLKTIETLSGSIEILEMTSPDGTISTVPMNPANADYQEYLNPSEAETI
jgi:hypothetical protein